MATINQVSNGSESLVSCVNGTGIYNLIKFGCIEFAEYTKETNDRNIRQQ